MKRRTFIQKAATGTLSAAALSAPWLQTLAADKRWEYGIILSSLKKDVREDPETVFRKLAKAGYTYIESIGRYGIPAEHTMPHILKYGLKPLTLKGSGKWRKPGSDGPSPPTPCPSQSSRENGFQKLEVRDQIF